MHTISPNGILTCKWCVTSSTTRSTEEDPMSRAFRLVLLSACLSVSLTAWAADEDPQDQLAKAAATEAGSGWLLGAGVAVTNPGYLGYSRQITPVPLVFYHYGRFFFAGFSAGYLLSNGEHYRFSLLVTPQFNRLKASDS